MRRILGILLFIAVIAVFASAATPDKAEQIDKLLNKWHDIGLLNGVVLVADHDEIIYKRGFGYANFEWKIPNTPETRFRIGSVTKPFTATLILQQVQAGKIKLDAPISTYLPEYRKETGAKVTVRHLLTHTSGIPTYIGRQIEQLQGRSVPLGEFVKQFCSGDLETEPGTKFVYNNCGYLLLGQMVENVTGKKYDEALRDGIAEPAALADTGEDRNDLVLERRATGYDKSYVRGLVKAQYTDLGTALGAGDMYSTAEDLFRFQQALYGDKLLKAEMRELMFRPTSDRYAMGWFTHKAAKGHPAEGDSLESHEGNIWGFFTNVVRVPERKAAVIVIDNTHMDVFDEITDGVLSILYKGTYEEPKPLAIDVIAPMIMKDGIAAAVAQYRELKRTKPEAYDFSGLNGLGSDLMANGRAKDAVEIFKLNVERNPNGWGPYYMLGEAYRQLGETRLAIASYEEALKKSPNNPPATQALKQLK